MENTSKALLIAAAVLVAIIVITIGIKIFTSSSDTQKIATDTGKTIDEKTSQATGIAISEIQGRSVPGISGTQDIPPENYPEMQTSSKWTQDGTRLYNGTTTLQIGDIVNYNELSNGAKSYTTDTTKGVGGSVEKRNTTTYDFPLNSKTYTTEDLTWRVLGVNEVGQIELISENPMSVENKLYLANEKGYLYGPEELNKMCNNLYGKGKGALSARCLNVDDVDKLAGIITDEDKKACTRDYGSKWKYKYPTTEEESGTRYMRYNKDIGSGYGDNWYRVTDVNCRTFKMPCAATSTRISSTNPGYSPELIYTEYWYRISEKVKKTATDGTSIADLLVKGTTSKGISQFLASKIVKCSSDGVQFCVGCLSSYGSKSTGLLYVSYNYKDNFGVRVRPVVTLESNILLSGSSSEGWTIQ